MPTGPLLPAHGVGGPKDLPIPPELAIAGAAAALVVSFVVLAVAWREPRYDHVERGRTAPAWLHQLVGSRGWRWGWRAVGLVVAGYTAVALVLGPDLLTNPAFGIFYIWWWVGLVPLSLLFGPVWRALSPVRTLTAGLVRISGADPDNALLRYPERWGYWPAALGLYAFVWLELVYPHSTELGPVRLWCAAYVAVMLVGGTLFGSTFFARADPFEVYSGLVARLSVWGRREGQLVVRSPLANLAGVTPRPGLVAVVAVLFGSTAFDSFRDASAWVGFVQSSSVPEVLLHNVALLVFCTAAGVIFALGCVLTGVGDGLERRSLPRRFAHSMVPIIVAYVAAHYLSYLVQGSQSTLILASDPLGTGANLFGTGDWAVNYWLVQQPTLLAVTKVLVVVLGHVLGVVAAHDRAVTILPRRHQLTGQLPLLVAMVAFTVGGLYLLFAA